MKEIVDLSHSEAAGFLRQLEFEAYGSVISVFRAQGDLNQEKQRILTSLSKALNISINRHKCEIRRVLNDERLSSISKCLTGTVESERGWVRDGRRIIPLVRRATPITSFTVAAEEIKNKASDFSSASAEILHPSATLKRERILEKLSPASKTLTKLSELLDSKKLDEQQNGETEVIPSKGDNTDDNVVYLPSGKVLKILEGSKPVTEIKPHISAKDLYQSKNLDMLFSHFKKFPMNKSPEQSYSVYKEGSNSVLLDDDELIEFYPKMPNVKTIMNRRKNQVKPSTAVKGTVNKKVVQVSMKNDSRVNTSQSMEKNMNRKPDPPFMKKVLNNNNKMLNNKAVTSKSTAEKSKKMEGVKSSETIVNNNSCSSLSSSDESSGESSASSGSSSADSSSSDGNQEGDEETMYQSDPLRGGGSIGNHKLNHPLPPSNTSSRGSGIPSQAVMKWLEDHPIVSTSVKSSSLSQTPSQSPSFDGNALQSLASHPCANPASHIISPSIGTTQMPVLINHPVTTTVSPSLSTSLSGQQQQCINAQILSTNSYYLLPNHPPIQNGTAQIPLPQQNGDSGPPLSAPPFVNNASMAYDAMSNRVGVQVSPSNNSVVSYNNSSPGLSNVVRSFMTNNNKIVVQPSSVIGLPSNTSSSPLLVSNHLGTFTPLSASVKTYHNATSIPISSSSYGSSTVSLSATPTGASYFHTPPSPLIRSNPHNAVTSSFVCATQPFVNNSATGPTTGSGGSSSNFVFKGATPHLPVVRLGGHQQQPQINSNLGPNVKLVNYISTTNITPSSQS